MLGFILVLSCSFAIFITISAIAMMKRRQNATQNVGYVVNPNGTLEMVSPTTHTTPYAMPVTHYPPSVCQPVIITTPAQSPNGYYPPPSYQYQFSAQNISQPTPGWSMQAQGVQAVTTGGQASTSFVQPPVYSEAVSNAEITILPNGKPKPVTQHVHEGAVETVSTL